MMSVNVTLRWSKRHVKVHQCLLAATSAMLLGGCATERGHSLALDTGSIDPAYQDWFDGGAPADMDSMDWGRIDFARQAAEAGNAQRAEGLLESLMNEGFPPAYYEMGKLYEEGLGVAPDPARAADYYGQALRRPSLSLAMRPCVLAASTGTVAASSGMTTLPTSSSVRQ
ncbi:hypothetical protein [Modicisalibacter luteus]|uniref:hypothetical protein n=1 Tax=Modicisalibacter luteus TaxID=453962 RepID=UPI00362691F3